MKTAGVSVSIVIPAYNEEDHLRACLDAIAAQTVQPMEVLVVDNNSTDATVAVARSYPFVTLMSEKKQGPAYARDAGYDAASGDIIGRIDADTQLAPDWVACVQQIFSDKRVGAASGIVGYYGVCLPGVFGAVDVGIRRYLAKRMGAINELFLYGANMAIRRTAWQRIRSDMCYGRELHEDLDLAVHAVRQNVTIAFAPSMRGMISARRADTNAWSFYQYVMSSPRVYAAHAMRAQRYIYPVAWFVLALYMPIRLLYRGYNPATGSFSLRCIFRPVVTTGRVSPVASYISPLD